MTAELRDLKERTAEEYRQWRKKKQARYDARLEQARELLSERIRQMVQQVVQAYLTSDHDSTVLWRLPDAAKSAVDRALRQGVEPRAETRKAKVPRAGRGGLPSQALLALVIVLALAVIFLLLQLR
jgi:hypothetical protein